MTTRGNLGARVLKNRLYFPDFLVLILSEFLTCLIPYLAPPDHFLLAMGKNNSLKMLLAAGPAPPPLKGVGVSLLKRGGAVSPFYWIYQSIFLFPKHLH
jgi:hypothetical protein